MKNRKSIRRLIVAAGVLSLLCFFIGFEIYISSEWLCVNTYELESEKIDDPAVFVIISDLHNHDFGKELPDKIKEQKPDAVLMTGDMINGNTEHPELIYNLISELKDTVPVYYAIGNHELEYMKTHTAFIEELEASGCKVLDKEYVDIEINGGSLRLGGLYDYPFGLNDNLAETAPQDIQGFLNDFLDTDRFTIMMSHRPDSFIFGNVSKIYDIDLVAAGHIHGGQIILPFAGGLYGGDQGWFPEYDHGLFQKDKLHLIITSGLGSSEKKLPRFNNIPEILVLKIS